MRDAERYLQIHDRHLNEILIEARKDEIEKVETALEAIRTAAAGKEIGTFETVPGKSYQAMTTRSVVLEGIKISHRDGAATVPIDELPQALRNSYGFALQDTLEAAKNRSLPDVAKIGPGLDGGVRLKIRTKEEILGQQRHLTDAERLMNAQIKEARLMREEAKALMAKEQPGSVSYIRGMKLREQAREIEIRLGLPSPKDE